jgi:putative ABC transport system permease protein
MKFTQLFAISFQSILNNKLRTSLTVLGVVVGIFSIIVIMTIITMLQNSIEDGLSLLNKNTFQIEKFDRTQGRGPGSDRSWPRDVVPALIEAGGIEKTLHLMKPED